MKAVTVKCDSIQVTQGRMEPKLCLFPTASVEGKEIYIGPSGQWKIKGKELCQVEITKEEITLETEKRLTFVLMQMACATDAEERQWELFGCKINSLYEKYHSKQAQHFSKFIETSSKHNLGTGNIAKRASVGAASRTTAAAPRRGVFGSQCNVIQTAKRPHMPWDDEGIMGDDDEPRPKLISGGQKLKHPIQEELFSSDEEDELQKPSETKDRAENDMTARCSEEKEYEEEFQQVRTKMKGRRTMRSNDDDDTDDDAIFHSELDLTTPAAQRLISPGGTNVTISAPHAPRADDEDKSNSEAIASADAVERNQPSISSFFPPRKPVALPRSFDPRNNHTTTPAKTPPRHFASANAARFANAVTAATTAKKKRLHKDSSTSWLQKSPARKILSPSEKRQIELFGTANRKRPVPSKLDDVEDEDPIEEFSSPPRRGVFKRPTLSEISENALSWTRSAPTPMDLPTDLTVGGEFPNAQPRFRGLRNLGNTCYLNASLQLLYTCRDLMSALRRCKGGSLTRSVCMVGQELQQVNLFSVSPNMVKDAMDEKTDKFAGYEQRDAHEFLSELIDFVHEELEEESKTDEEVAGETANETKENKHLPTDDFYMTVQVCLKCCSCGYSRNKEEMYRHLSIDIDSDESSIFDATSQEISKASVEKSLGHFFQPEVREIKCEKCKDGTHAQQTLRILSRPKFLLLHLKRFIAVERPISPVTKGEENHSPNSPPKPVQIEYIFKKNKAPIAIPSSLSLEAFRAVAPAQSIDPLAVTSGESLSEDYSLKSIVHHIGSRASSGHYTADAVRHIEESQDGIVSEKSAKPVWVTFDDSNTSYTSLIRIVENRLKQGTAYMLLYTLDDDRIAST